MGSLKIGRKWARNLGLKLNKKDVGKEKETGKIRDDNVLWQVFGFINMPLFDRVWECKE